MTTTTDDENILFLRIMTRRYFSRKTYFLFSLARIFISDHIYNKFTLIQSIERVLKNLKPMDFLCFINIQ